MVSTAISSWRSGATPSSSPIQPAPRPSAAISKPVRPSTRRGIMIMRLLRLRAGAAGDRRPRPRSGGVLTSVPAAVQVDGGELRQPVEEVLPDLLHALGGGSLE